jgi:hypothetical protein
MSTHPRRSFKFSQLVGTQTERKQRRTVHPTPEESFWDVSLHSDSSFHSFSSGISGFLSQLPTEELSPSNIQEIVMLCFSDRLPLEVLEGILRERYKLETPIINLILQIVGQIRTNKEI